MNNNQSKTPMELLSDFVTDMKMCHGLVITEVNFDQQSYDKLNVFAVPKERIILADEAEPAPLIGNVFTTVGKVKLGVK